MHNVMLKFDTANRLFIKSKRCAQLFTTRVLGSGAYFSNRFIAYNVYRGANGLD